MCPVKEYPKHLSRGEISSPISFTVRVCEGKPFTGEAVAREIHVNRAKQNLKTIKCQRRVRRVQMLEVLQEGSMVSSTRRESKQLPRHIVARGAPKDAKGNRETPTGGTLGWSGGVCGREEMVSACGLGGWMTGRLAVWLERKAKGA